jgi:histidinol-phosphate aminotransferase
MGISYLPTDANFIYFDIPAKSGRGRDNQFAKSVYAALLRKGVIIRRLEGRSLRVSIGKPSELRRFIRSLQEVLQ